ncbi:hypothetical protein D3C71_2001330 [compost metagenome]
MAVDLERDRLVEAKHRAAVESGEGLAVEHETDGHHRAFGPTVELEAGLAVASDGGDGGVLEHRAVEVRGVFGLIVEPQAGGEFLDTRHGGSP